MRGRSEDCSAKDVSKKRKKNLIFKHYLIDKLAVFIYSVKYIQSSLRIS